MKPTPIGINESKTVGTTALRVGSTTDWGDENPTANSRVDRAVVLANSSNSTRIRYRVATADGANNQVTTSTGYVLQPNGVQTIRVPAGFDLYVIAEAAGCVVEAREYLL